MLTRARIRTAGTIAATAMCAAVATEAAAQTSGPIVIDQVQLGDVLADQTLNVAYPDQVTAETYGAGNTASAAGDADVAIQVQSDQTMSGQGRATTGLDIQGVAYGPVSVTTQIEGNRLEAQAQGADLDVSARQTVDAVDLIAETRVGGDPGRMLEGGHVQSAAQANVVALAGSGGVVTADIGQTSSAFVQADTLGELQYIPAEATFAADAVGNTVASTVTGGDQDLTIRQSQTGAQVWATSSANAGNGWDLAGRARATANQVSVVNQGGSVIARTDQNNAAGVRADATTTAFDYGEATAHAAATGNAVNVGNNDVYLRIDNTQLNSGGVEATAQFSGTTGYDAYVGADAVGNTVTGYACSTCPGYLEAASTQVNTADVTATAVTRIDGSGRAVITGVNAVGNSATFYVSRPGGGP